MTDKERLEEIKGRVLKERCTYTVGDDSSSEGYRYILSDEDYRWLKEQAERVEELEKDLDEWRNEAIKVFKRFEEYQERYLETKEVLHSTVSENKRLREALEFYAVGNHYSDNLHHDKIILLDNGEIARKALDDAE